MEEGLIEEERADLDSGPLGRVVAALNALGSVWIILLMLIIVADITMRTVASMPISGTPEIVSFSIVGIVFLQLAHTLRTGNLTRTDMVLNYLGAHHPAADRLLRAAFHAIGAALLAIALVLFLPKLGGAWTKPERNYMGNPGFFTLPLWPLYGLMVIGMVATILQFVASAIQSIRGEKT